MRTTLFTVGLILLLLAPAGAQNRSDLAFLDIEQLQARMEEDSLTSVELVSLYVQRMAEIDRAGPTLRSVIEINPDAFRIAAELDRERQTKGPRSPLHGIPVLLKANIDTGDEMDTTAGSLALLGHKAPDDAFHVKALREAGAIILGKTNLSEWANFRSSNSSSGWSSIGGQTRNPYSTDRNPCGSSSGSAVAVAAGLTVVSIGTETDGSVVCPAGINGVVGIKPTVGLVSRDGIIPIAHTQDTAGPMARSVRDAAILLTAMARKDPSDPAVEGHPISVDYAARLDSDALKGARIGVVRDYAGAEGNPRVGEIFDAAIKSFSQAGATLVDPVDLEIPDEAYDAEYEVLLFEFKTDLNAYLAEAGADPGVDTLAGIIGFNRAHADRVMPWFGQEIFEKAVSKGSLDDPAYLKALKESHEVVAKHIDRVMREHDLDAIIAPTNGPSWTTDLVNGDHWGSNSVSSSSPAAISGYPAVTIPMGEVHGLPIGLSFLGLPFKEDRLLGLAYSAEARLGTLRMPRFRPATEAPDR
jgi:amidase